MVLVDPSRNHEVLPDRSCSVNVGQVVRKVNDQEDVTSNFMYVLHSLFHYSLAAGVVERKVVVSLSRLLLTVSKRRESISNEFHNRRDRSLCLFVCLVVFMFRGRGGRGQGSHVNVVFVGNIQQLLLLLPFLDSMVFGRRRPETMNGPLLWRNPRRSRSILPTKDSPLERLEDTRLVFVVRRGDIHRVVPTVLGFPCRGDELDFVVHP